MLSECELYKMGTDRMLTHEVALQGTEYEGQIVLGGPDAAIEIKGASIALFMHGVPTENSAFAHFVAGYHEALIDTAKKLANGKDEAVVIAGKWHHVEYHCEPFFAPYLIHVRSADGTARSEPYDIHVFDTDDAEEGRGYNTTIDDLEKSEIIDWLRCSTESLLSQYGSSPTSSGQPRFVGMLWRPMDITRSPVFINFSGEYAELEAQQIENGEFACLFGAVRSELKLAVEQDTITEGTRLAIETFLAVSSKAPEEDGKKAMARLLDILSKSPVGVRSGEPIFRSEMPIGDATTIEEIANSTTAGGHWLEMREVGGKSNKAIFHPFDHIHRVARQGAAVLRRREPNRQDDFLGCAYASDWRYEGGGYEFRWLAFGPVPTLSW
jgi:hypothetical protein